MKIKIAAMLVGLVMAGAPALATIAHAREPAPVRASPAAQAAAVKKPAAKQTRAGSPRGGEDADPLAEVPSFSAEAVGWQLVEDAKTGARLGVPEKLTPHVSASRSGTRWSSAQGQIQIETFQLAEAALPALFDEEKKTAHRQITSSNLKPDSFVIVGVQGLKNFVVRADAHGSEVRGVTVLYDQATEGTMGRVAINVANAFVGFPDPNAMPPPGLRRRVEYGSAIVVGSDGDLIASVRNVDDCQAITVPPFGHAERIAEDKANDLALIRLYGARNLVAAPLADAGVQSGRCHADRRRRSAGPGRRCAGERAGPFNRARHRSGAEARLFRRRRRRCARPPCRHGRSAAAGRRRQRRRRRSGRRTGAGRDDPRLLASAAHRAGRRDKRVDQSIGAARGLRAEMTAGNSMAEVTARRSARRSIRETCRLVEGLRRFRVRLAKASCLLAEGAELRLHEFGLKSKHVLEILGLAEFVDEFVNGGDVFLGVAFEIVTKFRPARRIG